LASVEKVTVLEGFYFSFRWYFFARDMFGVRPKLWNVENWDAWRFSPLLELKFMIVKEFVYVYVHVMEERRLEVEGRCK